MASAGRCAKPFIAPAPPRSSSPISIRPAREAVAASIGGAAFKCDVGQEKDILHVIEETEQQFGPIALFCSNAGIGGGFDPLSENAGGNSDEPWARSWADSCHGACLCRAASDPAHEGARRRLFPQHDFRGGTAVAGRQPGLFHDQTCRGRFCRKPRDLAPGRTASRSRSCVRRASTPTCCDRSRRVRNPAMAI